MSIINDAIKKARKEFLLKNQPPPPPTCVSRTEERRETPQQPAASEMKWTVAVTTSLVVIVSLLGSLALYKHMSRVGVEYGPAARSIKQGSFSSPSNIPGQKSVFPTGNLKGTVELNGIVYGPQDKWAIINNKIFREGDSLLDGEVTVIAKDYVKIEKSDGEEITLDLK